MINYKKSIARTLESQIGISEKEIEELIEISKLDYKSDFTLPCFKLVHKFKFSPNIIAEDLKKKFKNKYFEKVDSIGPYLNFYIDKRYASKSILKEILDKGVYYGFTEDGKGKVINIEYYYSNLANISNMEVDLLQIAVYSLEKILKKNGYKVKCGNDSYDEISLLNEISYNDINSIIETLKEKNLLTEQNGCEIISLEKFNLPAYIILKEEKEKKFNINILNKIINVNKNYSYYKSVYMLNSASNTHFNQVIAILEMLGYKWSENFIRLNLGIVKVLGNYDLNKKGRIISLDDLIKKVAYIIGKNVNTTKVDYDNKTLNKISRYSIVFNYIINLNEKFIVFDLEYITSFKEKNFLYVLKSFNKASSICCNLNNNEILDDDMLDITNEQFNLIKALEFFKGEVYKAKGKLQLEVIAKYIIKVTDILNEVYLNLDLERNKFKRSDLILIKSTCQVIENSLDLLGIKLVLNNVT